MRNLMLLLSLCLLLLSCNNNPDNNRNNLPPANGQHEEELQKFILKFNDPVLLDSSVYVMYPLPLQSTLQENSDYGYSSYDRQINYWNIIFYNTATGASHLLNTSQRMVIHAYDPRSHHSGKSYASTSTEFNPQPSRSDQLIFYTITTKDQNQDGELTSDDPTYLYVSDKNGQNFRQISPDNHHLTDWTTVKHTSKVLLQVKRDTNNDKTFTDNDETIPMVYDLINDSLSTAVFSEAYKLELKKRFSQQWGRKN